jgi:hypothetical protein
MKGEMEADIWDTGTLFKDKDAMQEAATIRAGENDVEFGDVALGNGVIVCE